MMNSIERVLAALTYGQGGHGTPDRVPVFPVPLMQGALVHKCTVAEYFKMPAQKIAEAQVAINQMFEGVPDGVAGFPNVIQDVTGFGMGLKYHYANSTPAVDGMLIQSPQEIEGLKEGKYQGSPDLCKTLEIIERLACGIGKEKVVIGACIAPFSLPSMLMGTAGWMRLLYTPRLRERYMQRLLDICEKFTVSWANAQLRAGAHVVVLADGMASATMIPEDVFAKHACGLIKRTIRQINGMVAYEAVGRVEPYAHYYADSGAVAILIGEDDDIGVCKQALGGRVGVIGNVNNMKMRRWPPARVALMAKRAINAGMDGYGFILANQGPELPFDVGLEQIGALINAVEVYGRYEKKETGEFSLAA